LCRRDSALALVQLTQAARQYRKAQAKPEGEKFSLFPRKRAKDIHGCKAR
jgi:hypothetical protein